MKPRSDVHFLVVFWWTSRLYVSEARRVGFPVFLVAIERNKPLLGAPDKLSVISCVVVAAVVGCFWCWRSCFRIPDFAALAKKSKEEETARLTYAVKIVLR